MGNEYYGAPTTPTTDYLAHYGIKGMKWGVRKARESGNMRALGRQYRKAEKKLAKLEKRAASGKKYAKRAALLGAGAAASGGLAAIGTMGAANVMRGAGNTMIGAGSALGKAAKGVKNQKIRSAMQSAAAGMAYGGLRTNRAAGGVQTWGGGKNIGEGVKKLTAQGTAAGQTLANQMGRHGLAGNISKYGNEAAKKAGTISNSGYARIAAAGLGAGLAGAAGYNAYRAATTKRAARKAAEFRREMNKQFAGYNPNGGSRKRRRR